MAEPLKQALREALASYLQTYLNANLPGVTVSSSWPQPNVPLPPMAVTVLAPGQPRFDGHATAVHYVTPTVSPNATVAYSYGTCSVGMQLDVWANFPAVRDQIVATLEGALNRPPGDTLGITTLAHASRSPGLVIRASNLYNAPVAFRFSVSPDYDESAQAASDGEWRATYTGDAFVYVMNQETFALIKQLTLNVGTESRSIISP